MRAHLNDKISEKVASNDPAKQGQKSEEGEEAKGESDEGRSDYKCLYVNLRTEAGMEAAKAAPVRSCTRFVQRRGDRGGRSVTEQDHKKDDTATKRRGLKKKKKKKKKKMGGLIMLWDYIYLN